VCCRSGSCVCLGGGGEREEGRSQTTMLTMSRCFTPAILVWRRGVLSPVRDCCSRVVCFRVLRLCISLVLTPPPLNTAAAAAAARAQEYRGAPCAAVCADQQ
jgi:hypothetical protein